MKKILSIDGGGIRGIIPARLLKYIERQTDKPISECFDLIAGTSTGGILALALALADKNGKPKYPASKLLELYQTHGQDIFPKSVWRNITSLGGMTEELYSSDGLEEVLDDYCGDALLGSALTKVLVTAYDIERRKPVFFKSWKNEFEHVKVKDAARATSAAPTYFEPAHIKIKENEAPRALIDGGVFINSPGVSAYAQAKRLFPNEQDFLMLSLGTGELIRSIPFDKAKSWGKAGWLVPLLNCMFDGVADATDYQLKRFLGDDRYFRMQITLEYASDDMDDATKGNILNLERTADELLEKYKKEMNTVCSLL